MESSPQIDTKELFSLVSEGDKQAFIELFKTYTPSLNTFISRVVRSDFITDEIIQETFMRIWYNREKLAIVKDPQKWIFNIASVACYSLLKELFAGNKISSAVQREFYYRNNEVFEAARLHRLAADIHEAVNDLSPEQRKVYTLSRGKGLKTTEIAERLSTSPNIVRNILNSSMGFLTDYLHDRGHSF
jgi:RNA polymerase sigma-19 factor, ECF subfamily